MVAKFVTIDHETPLLLPPDLRDWVEPDHMVHFIMDGARSPEPQAVKARMKPGA